VSLANLGYSQNTLENTKLINTPAINGEAFGCNFATASSYGFGQMRYLKAMSTLATVIQNVEKIFKAHYHG